MLADTGKKLRVKGTLDGSPLGPRERGERRNKKTADTSVLEADFPRMYRIVRTGKYAVRELALEAEGPGKGLLRVHFRFL